MTAPGDEAKCFTLPLLLDEIDRDLRRFDWIAALSDETQLKVIALMMFSADHPDWAWVHFYTEIGRKTVGWIAATRQISQSTVRRLLTVKVPEEIYDLLPPEPRAKGE